MEALADRLWGEMGWRDVPTTTELVRLADAHGWQVVDYPLRGRMVGLCCPGVIDGRPNQLVIQAGLSVPRYRRVLAHEIGHALLHRGQRLDTFFWPHGALLSPWEIEAERFAGFLLFGPALPRLRPPTTRDLAAYAQLPHEFVARWWRYNGARVRASV